MYTTILTAILQMSCFAGNSTEIVMILSLLLKQDKLCSVESSVCPILLS